MFLFLFVEKYSFPFFLLWGLPKGGNPPALPPQKNPWVKKKKEQARRKKIPPACSEGLQERPYACCASAAFLARNSS